MVARTYDVDMLLRKDLSRVVPLGIRGIVEAISFYAVPSINQQKVFALAFCFFS